MYLQNPRESAHAWQILTNAKLSGCDQKNDLFRQLASQRHVAVSA
jgi:predicted site-specific integrase-resolvase